MKSVIFAIFLSLNGLAQAATLDNKQVISAAGNAIFKGSILKDTSGTLYINDREVGECTVWKSQHDTHHGHIYYIENKKTRKVIAHTTIWARKTLLTGDMTKTRSGLILEAHIKNPRSALVSEKMLLTLKRNVLTFELAQTFKNGSQRKVACIHN